MLTAIVLADELRVWVPTLLLSSSMVPYATTYITFCLPTRMISKELLQWLDNRLYTSYLRLCSFVFECVSNVSINFYGDISEIRHIRETALIMSNHSSDVDWAVINMLATRQTSDGMEYGLRFVVKSAINFVPLFGWYIFQHGYIYVRRFGHFVPDPLLRQFKNLRELNEPFWLHIFPEGTRFSRKKQKLIEISQEYAKKSGLHIPEYTLLPRVGAFTLARMELKDTVEYIYDVTIAYDQTLRPTRMGLAPNMFEFVSSGIGSKGLHIHVRRIPISDVPLKAEEIRRWLYDRFAKKDELLQYFYGNGEFPDLYEKNAPKISFNKTIVPFAGFLGALILPIFSKTVRNIYLGTIAASPLLIAWLHLRKCV
jgi:1-acyl-sn-glycerol-3-phosphate acyltransferase